MSFKIGNALFLETTKQLEIREAANRRLQQELAVLQESEERLAVTLSSIGDAVVATDAQARVTSLNPVAATLTGWSQEEAAGRPVDEIFHIISQETRLPSSIPIMKTLAQGTIQGLANHTILVARDGREYSIADSCAPIRNRDGRVVGAVLVFRDVSKEYAAQQALREAGALQRAIFDSASFSCIATDAHGVIQIFNVGAERMLGYAAADVVDRITPADLSDPEELIERARALSLECGTPIAPGFDALAYKASRRIEDIHELTHIRKDGSRFQAELSVTALRDDEDAIIGYLLIGTDNTARKQIEAEQERLAQRLSSHQFFTRSLFEFHVDALITTDLSGTITDVNRQMEVLTGRTRDELIGAPFRDCFASPEAAEASLRRVLLERKISDCELTACGRGGERTVVSCNATTFYDRDRTVQGVFVAARDVTERKRQDAALHDRNAELRTARIQADKANLAKSEFLSRMSHELRSPLNAILGFAQLLDTATPPATPPQKASIAQILHAGWYLLELINEILDLAVVESGKLQLSVEPVSLDDVLRECQAMVEPQSQQHRLDMRFPRFGLPLYILADRMRLKQVVVNLLSNAIKYNRPGGDVVVECLPGSEGRTRISVRDTGIGLSPEHLAQLFQAFNRLGQEGRSVEGTGIGLVMSKLLVELMGGEIGVTSTLGEGSEFWFELATSDRPHLASEPAGPADVPGPIAPDVALRTLLYVEDNRANLDLVEQLVARRDDLRLLSAGNGFDGIQKAREFRPDLILMDIHLPGMSGIEAMKILGDDPRTAHIPVIAISANAMSGDVRRGLEAGFFGYLTKPIDVPKFMAEMDAALAFAKDHPPGRSHTGGTR